MTFVSARQICKPAGPLPVTLQTVRAWAKSGQFPAPLRIGGRNYWPAPTVNDWLTTQGLPPLEAL